MPRDLDMPEKPYFDNSPPKEIVSLQKFEDRIIDPLKALATDLKSLLYEDMLTFAKGVCAKNEKPHDFADRVLAWTKSKLNPQERANETRETQQVGQQDAGEGYQGQ